MLYSTNSGLEVPVTRQSLETLMGMRIRRSLSWWREEKEEEEGA